MVAEEDITAGRRTEADTISQDGTAQLRMSTASASALGGGGTSLEVTFANSDQYIYSIVQNMVDSVCLY